MSKISKMSKIIKMSEMSKMSKTSKISKCEIEGERERDCPISPMRKASIHRHKDKYKSQLTR
jgi:hypothetical protein